MEGLAAMSADSGSLTMELAKSLVDNLDFGDAERIWEKFRPVESEPCGTLPDDELPLLQEEKTLFIPRQNVHPTLETTLSEHYIQGLLFMP